MGLREKALQVKKDFSSEMIDHLEEYFEGRVLTRPELNTLKADFERKLQSITSRLDRKIIDMQTMLEIGKELNSTLKLTELIQIFIFTLIGQFRLSDIAVFILNQKHFELMDKKGKLDLTSFQSSDEFIEWIKKLDRAISIKGIHPFPDLLKMFDASGLSLLVPIKSKEDAVGLVLLGHKAGKEPYDSEDLNLIYTLTSLSGVAIENARLYETLDKKYSELTTLYEVSRVINTSSDYSTVLNLIIETITTGFGVKKAILFIQDMDRCVIQKTVGSFEKTAGQVITLNSQTISLLKENKTGIVQMDGTLAGGSPLTDTALFIPLVSIGRKIGGIIVFETDRYEIRQDNLELVNLFSIIASQIAPSALLTWMIRERKELMEDPYQSTIRLMETEINQAKEFEIPVTFLMLRLNHLKKFTELHGLETAKKQTAALLDGLKKMLPESASMARYTSDQILFILPAMAESEIMDFKDSIHRKANEVFNNSQQMLIEANILTSKYPESGMDPFALLSLIE